MNIFSYRYFFKRIFDLFFSLLSLVIFFPLFIIIILFQIIFNGLPIFFIQNRVGKNEKIFKLIKFRTMNFKKDSNGFLLPDVQRRTFFGSILRKTSLDEIPSLINILIGDMSFVGPRPLLIEYLPLYNNQQKLRHLVRPGLSGLAQIRGRNRITWKKKFEYDLEYISRLSFTLDIKIIILTLLKVIFYTHEVNQSKLNTFDKFNGNN